MSSEFPHEMPMRKFRQALGLTTAEAGQYANVTRKTWEAWEAAEVAGKSAPISAVELVYSKLVKISDAKLRHAARAQPRDIVVVFKTIDQLTGHQMPIDAIAADTFLGIEQGDQAGTAIVKSMAVAWGTGRPYVHRTIFDTADNAHVLRFAERHAK